MKKFVVDAESGEENLREFTTEEVQEILDREAIIGATTYERSLKEWEEVIKRDYEINSDPFVPQVMCGEKTLQDLISARNAVKERNPKPIA